MKKGMIILVILFMPIYIFAQETGQNQEEKGLYGSVQGGAIYINTDSSIDFFDSTTYITGLGLGYNF